MLALPLCVLTLPLCRRFPRPRKSAEPMGGPMRLLLGVGGGWGEVPDEVRLALVRLRWLALHAKPKGLQSGHAIHAMPHLQNHLAAVAPL